MALKPDSFRRSPHLLAVLMLSTGMLSIFVLALLLKV